MTAPRAAGGGDPSWQRAGRAALRVLVALLLVSLPFATALVAIGHAPPAHIRIAGQDVTVRPVLGQDHSQLFGGALVRSQYQRLPVLGRPIGVDVDADWNRIVPSDKSTRRYVSDLWANPEPAIHLIEIAARRHVLIWGGGGFGVGAALAVGVVLLARQRRRRLAGYDPLQAELVDRHNRRLRRTGCVAGVVVVLVLDVLAVRVYRHEDRQRVVPDPVFAGTELEGTEVKGLLADVLPFLSVLRPRSTFYDDVADHLEQALAERPELRDTDDTVTFVLAEDFEDVNGMARQVGVAARALDADFIALSGDLTFAGKPVETYLLDTVDYYSRDRPVYLAPGLHDTHEIEEAARSRDWHVADGTTQTIDGMTLLPLPDPRISQVGDFGSGDVLRDPDVDTQTFLADATRRACADRPDFVLLHDHLLGRPLAQAGCQGTAVLDGRSYQLLGPQRVTTERGTTTTEYTSGSGGGHVDTTPNPGVIQHPARFTVLTFRPDTKETRYAVVTVAPDASVTVSRPLPLSVPWTPAAG